MRPPTRAQFLAIAKKYRYKRRLPHCIGCVDGKHIRITAPEKGSLFYNYKGYHSIVLMADGDAAFPLNENILRPYPSRNLTTEHHTPRLYRWTLTRAELFLAFSSLNLSQSHLDTYRNVKRGSWRRRERRTCDNDVRHPTLSEKPETSKHCCTGFLQNLQCGVGH